MATPQHVGSTAMMSGLFRGQGRMSDWLQEALGVDPRHLHPSVRFGLEGALLTALAAQRGESLSFVLGNGGGHTERDGSGSCEHAVVHVNALLDSSGSAREVAAEAARLAGQGFTALKIKVRDCDVFSGCKCWRWSPLSVCTNWQRGELPGGLQLTRFRVMSTGGAEGRPAG